MFINRSLGDDLIFWFLVGGLMSAISGLVGIWTLFCAVSVAGVAYCVHALSENAEAKAQVIILPSSAEDATASASEASDENREPFFDWYLKSSKDIISSPIHSKFIGHLSRTQSAQNALRSATVDAARSIIVYGEPKKTIWDDYPLASRNQVIRVGDAFYRVVRVGSELKLLPLTSEVSL
ncbi:MAG: hypothetical protein MK104_03235 [Erythrobacter sp.]|nr:hypothetical protein [Erythrobacter sp.]